MFTNPVTVGVVFSSLWLLLAVPAAVCLILCYQKTRMNGFLWLLMSVVVWPLMARGFTLAINVAGPEIMAERGLTTSAYLNGMMLLSIGETTFGGTLLLVSTFLLYRQIVERMIPVAPYRPVDLQPPTIPSSPGF